jgi:hypothetical protein
VHNAMRLLKSNKTLRKIIYVFSVGEVRTGTRQDVDLRSWLVGCDSTAAGITVSSLQTNHDRSCPDFTHTASWLSALSVCC